MHDQHRPKSHHSPAPTRRAFHAPVCLLALLAAAALAAACDDSDDPWADAITDASADGDDAATEDAENDTLLDTTDVPDAHGADTSDTTDAAVDTDASEPRVCEGPLFGRPAANTGLDDSQCQPVCSCSDGEFVEPDYNDGLLDALLGYSLATPYEVPTEDPYAAGVDPILNDTTVCGVLFDDTMTYRLETFISERAALDAGAKVTHQGACGLCSTLEDLAVYIGVPDLTTPVRECGLQGLREGEDRNVECLLELGFTPPCAQIWFYNTRNTRNECAEPCFALLGQPYHNPDGTLNACLQCDEDISGPVFKAWAGRTRRNSGLATALCRPCGDVRPIAHVYGAGAE